MNNKKLAVSMLGLALVGGIGAGMVGLASADAGVMRSGMHGGRGPGVQGTVSSKSGTTLTVTDKNAVVYTVDASSAKVKKFTDNTEPISATVSDVAVGDSVAVKGTVSGTQVTATEIMDGLHTMRGPPNGKFGGMTAGKVTAVNGSTITVTDKDGGIYTIDTGAATFKKVLSGKLTDSTLSGIVVGSTIRVHGTVVTAHLTAKEVVLN